jgi:hypothetical protein
MRLLTPPTYLWRGARVCVSDHNVNTMHADTCILTDNTTNTHTPHTHSHASELATPDARVQREHAAGHGVVVQL